MNTSQLNEGKSLQKDLEQLSRALSAIRNGKDIRIESDGYDIQTEVGWFKYYDPETADAIRQILDKKIAALKRKSQKKFNEL